MLSTTTLPFAPLFRDPPDRQLQVVGVGGGEKDAAGKDGKQPLDSGRINTILWLTDWRVALLLIGSTYILGLGLTYLVRFSSARVAPHTPCNPSLQMLPQHAD